MPSSKTDGTQNTRPYGMNEAALANSSDVGGTTRSQVANTAHADASTPGTTNQACPRGPRAVPEPLRRWVEVTRQDCRIGQMRRQA